MCDYTRLSKTTQYYASNSPVSSSLQTSFDRDSTSGIQKISIYISFYSWTFYSIGQSNVRFELFTRTMLDIMHFRFTELLKLKGQSEGAAAFFAQ